jgi:hypothetical protein
MPRRPKRVSNPKIALAAQKGQVKQQIIRTSKTALKKKQP